MVERAKEPLVWINRLVLCGLGGYTSLYGVYQYFALPYNEVYEMFGQYHPALTYIIAGAGLIALTLKWGLYGFPLFLIATNFVENIWFNQTLVSYGAIQFVFIMFGYALSRPTFKQPAWLLVVALLNVMEVQPALIEIDYHHLAEISIYLVLLFDVKSLKWPLQGWFGSDRRTGQRGLSEKMGLRPWPDGRQTGDSGRTLEPEAPKEEPPPEDEH